MKYFYLSKDHAKDNGIWIYAESDTPIYDYFEKFGEDAYEYIGSTIPNCPWYDEKTDSVIEMPYNIKILRGISKIRDGEYLDENNEVVFVERPSDMISPVWDKECHIWIETYVENEDENIYDNSLDAIKARFFSYFDSYKKIIELSGYNIISISKDEIAECENFLKIFNPHSETFNIEEALKAEENMPKIIKDYM